MKNLTFWLGVFTAAVLASFHVAEHIYLLELANAMLFQLIGISIVIVGFNIYFKHWILAGFIGLAMMSHFYLAWPYWPMVGIKPCDDRPSLTVVQANLWHDNPTWKTALQNLSSIDADFLSVQEFNSAWVDAADSLLGSQWPFNLSLPNDSCCYGISLYSRHRLQSQQIHFWGNTPTLRAIAVTPVGKVVLYSVHTRPPAFPNETSLRDELLDSLANSIKLELFPVIVVGDLNIVPWDKKYQRFLQKTGLQDARRGFHATYPKDYGVPLIPIDHLCMTQLTPCGFGSFEIKGSDHRGVWARAVVD